MRTCKDFESYGREIFEKIKEYTIDGCIEIELNELMETAIKNKLVKYVKYVPEKHGYIPEIEDDDYFYWWGD